MSGILGKQIFFGFLFHPRKFGKKNFSKRYVVVDKTACTISVAKKSGSIPEKDLENWKTYSIKFRRWSVSCTDIDLPSNKNLQYGFELTCLDEKNNRVVLVFFAQTRELRTNWTKYLSHVIEGSKESERHIQESP
eukprot:TRINITY_DN16074_c0_g1_i1.p1 TRINITY_DN16074_c0_g1~~TRINITY_DN16074_c0_g1_i1.p1  ORF type:complete len:135 (+),score=10.66 TRINITY_DN16074_c0_g1_i1:69-473(+)